LGWATGALVSGAHLGTPYVPHLEPNPEPTPRPESDQSAVPRAIPTGRYWVDLPDGRHILVNYRGTVASFASLPPQPPGGANNAMYTDRLTGISWIWTVPAGASNVPTWIDP
jgi:hypothetical protein